MSAPWRCVVAIFILALGSKLGSVGPNASIAGPPEAGAQGAAAPSAPAGPPPSTVPAPRKDEWWTARHEAMNKAAAAGDAQVLMIGDSITEGWEGAGKEAWAKYLAPRKAINLGIGGDRTQQVLWRLENGNLGTLSPKVAVVMIGTNNTGTGAAPETTAAGVKAVVELLRSKLPQTKVLLLAIFPRGATSDDQMRKANARVNELIAPLADGSNVVWLDLGPKFLAEGGTLTREVMPDLLHLSPAAYDTWAREMDPVLARLTQ